MKSRKIITIVLCVALIVVSGWLISSFSSVKKVLDLNGEGQKTMELVEAEVIPQIDAAEDSEVSEPVVLEDIVLEDAAPEETPPSETSESTEVSTEETVTEETEMTEPESPVLKLSSDRITIAVGAEFNVISQVEEIADDKDDPIELYRHIRIGGEYDVNTPGEYVLEYIVTDLDGNDSDSQKLTLVVE